MDTVMIMSAVFKLDPESIIVLTKGTKIMTISNFDVPVDIARKANLLSDPPPASMVTLKDAKTSPAKTMISVKGRVTSVSCILSKIWLIIPTLFLHWLYKYVEATNISICVSCM